MPGTLYLVATPIGNFEDITLRALDVLRSADLVVYEERREGDRLLTHFQIQKPVETLNEHNEAAASFTSSGICSRAKRSPWCPTAVRRFFPTRGSFSCERRSTKR